MSSEKLIPKMFHRRLTLLLIVTAVVMTGLTAQLLRLSVVEGAQRRAIAEARLNRLEFLATVRGRILDRNGEELALDVPAYDVAVKYAVISGAWAIESAVDDARDELGDAWNEAGPTDREASVNRYLPDYERRTRELWDQVARLGGIDAAELENRLGQIRRSVEIMAADVTSKQRLEYHRQYGRPEPGVEDRFEPGRIAEEVQAHVVLPRVDDAVAFEFMRLAETLPGLEVIDSWRREYPWQAANVTLDRSSLPRDLRSDEPITIQVHVADHLIGAMRDTLYEADFDRRPFFDAEAATYDLQGYRVGDSIGSRGLESMFEDHLRGRRGSIHKRLDTGEQQRTEPNQGDDLQLTIDILLQARVQAIMSPEFGLARVQQYQTGWDADGNPKPTKLPLGRPLNGAAVVLDVDSGEILAMVSTPSFTDGIRMTPLRRAIDHPYMNRAVATPYPPGSIIKPLVLAAAVGEGTHRLGDRIACTGHYFDSTESARCWIYREVYGYMTHNDQLEGPLDAVQALSRSCNIYFYTLAHRKLGLERLSAWYRDFGLGARPDIGLAYDFTDTDGNVLRAGEAAGSLPSIDYIDTLRRRGDLEFNTAIAGIGQGPITWSPLQAANAYATIVRAGHFMSPVLIRQDPRTDHRRRIDDLDIGSPVVGAILEGLRQSVEETYGTGYGIRYSRSEPMERVFNAQGVTVWAKTGTAQAPALPVDSNGDGTVDSSDTYKTGLDHAWVVGLVGTGDQRTARPRYAIAVILEYGGSGGRAAGPIANQIIRALQAEGYL